MSNKNVHPTVSNKHTHTDVTTNVRKLDANEIDLDIEHARYQSSVASRPVFLGKGDATVTADEDKALHRALLRRYIHDDSIAIRLGKHDVLAKKDVRGKIERTRHTLLLTIYEGPLPIPTVFKNLDYNLTFTTPQRVDAKDKNDKSVSTRRMFVEWAKFKRSSIPAGRKHHESQRWFRIHGIQGNKDQVQYDIDNDIFHSKSAQFYLIPMDMVCYKQTLPQALSLNIGSSSNGRTLSMTQQQFVDLGGHLRVEKADQAIRARTALGESDQVHIFPGLRVVTEPSSCIYLDHNSGPLVELKSQTNVYLRSEYMTLSDFVAQHYRADLHCLQSSEGVKMLTANLRGVVVKLGSSNERRMVMGFKAGSMSDLPSGQLHHVSPSTHQSLTLPLVNVGTLEKPHFLPMEQCQIEDRQSLRGPRGVGLNHYVSFLTNAEAVMRLPGSCETAKASLVFHQLPETTDMDARLKKACNDKSPNLLFVEVGSSPVRSKGWLQLRNALKSRFQQSADTAKHLSAKGGISMPLLALRYDPKSDLSTQWTRKLRDFVAQCEKPDQKTIVIVWLEPEQDQSTMYNVIKTACDVYVGAQTFFVRRGTFENQIHNAPKNLNEIDRVSRYATDIQRRICQKNSHMLEQPAPREKRVEIVIAMHVSSVYSSPKRVSMTGGQHDKPDIYLVTFVSRDPAQSKNYCTEQGLFSRSQIMSQEHVKLMSALTKKMSSQLGNIVILRSGVLSFGQEDTGDSNDKFDLTNSASFKKFDAKETNAGSNAPDQKIQVQLPTPTSEMRAINKHFPVLKPAEGPRELTYVTLTENDSLSTRLDTKAYKDRPNDNCSAMLFIVGSDSLSVNVQQIPRVRSPSNLKQAVEVRPGAIKATFRRDWQSNVVNLATTSAQENGSHSPSHTDMEALTLTPEVDSEEIQDPMRVSDRSIDSLAALWTDDGLGLYNTKWPIPTHLARLAGKRAMIRLRTDDWHNEHTAPFSLPAVHENVRNTLYYL